MNIKNYIKQFITSGYKKPVPILSFPCISLTGTTVGKLVSDPVLQANGMKAVADRTNSALSLSFMDLSVEAECFGAEILRSDTEVPVVTGNIIKSAEDVENLKVPDVYSKRAGVYIEAVKKAKKLITDRPVFAGVIGPYSLAGRLMGETEAMMACFDDGDMMDTLLSKCTEFITEYTKAYIKAGADGVVLSEPLAGLLSPDLEEEFSAPYVRKIISEVRSDDFAVIYHNCGNSCAYMTESILSVGADAYHFGNAVDITEILEKCPSDTIIMGNLDPVELFRNGTPEKMKSAVKELMTKCSKYPNFVLSSGCDIPPVTDWANIDAFFEASDEFYGEK